MSASVLYDAVGPRGRRRIMLWSIVGAVGLLAVAAWVVLTLAGKGVFEAERWQVLFDADLQRRLLTFGLVNTVKAAGAAIVLSLLLGAVLAAGRISTRPWLAQPSRVLVEFLRGLPLLLLILFLFLGAPQLGVDLSVFWALVIALTLYNGAVIAEIFRAGLRSLPKGQSEAAYAIGLRSGQALRLVLVPQAVRLMLPALVSQLVTLLKDTSLGFIVGYEELLRTARNAVEFLGSDASIPVYVECAAIYIAVNLTLSWVARWLDRRTSRSLGETVVVRAADEAA